MVSTRASTVFLARPPSGTRPRPGRGRTCKPWTRHAKPTPPGFSGKDETYYYSSLTRRAKIVISCNRARSPASVSGCVQWCFERPGEHTSRRPPHGRARHVHRELRRVFPGASFSRTECPGGHEQILPVQCCNCGAVADRCGRKTVSTKSGRFVDVSTVSCFSTSSSTKKK